MNSHDRSLLTGHLSGCSVHLLFAGPPEEAKAELVQAVTALLTCKEHGGRHHFAVVRDGTELRVSPTGLQCVKEALDTCIATTENE
jgi:hypothetical protein